jgi:hypothetical protein
MARAAWIVRSGTLLALLIALTFAIACEESTETEEQPDVDPNLPPAQVDLPSPPPASAFEIAERNDDGTLRVEGLIQYQDKHLDGEVTVKGTLVEILGDCDPKKAKEAGEPCPEPHYIIKDEPDAQKELMVVGFDRDFLDEAELEVGDTHTFEGSYRKIAQQFVNSENGLLLLDKVDDISVLEEKD